MAGNLVNPFGALALEQPFTFLRQLLRALQPLSIRTLTTGRLNIDVNNVVGGVINTVSTVSSVTNVAAVGGVTGFEQARNITRTAYNTFRTRM